MKRNAFVFITVFYTLFMFGCEKEEAVTATELPQSAQDFISTHFANAAIASVQKEQEFRSTSYDVVLNNGTTLEFTENGECTDIDGKTNKLPDSVIAPQILAYVQTNHATDFIVSWEKDGAQQEVELGSTLELKFDQNHNFLRVDN